MLEIRPITIDQMEHLGGKLLQDHWDEVARNKQVMVLKPDYDRYRAMEAMGTMANIGLFDGEQLAGYSINIITNHLHYADLIVCQNDIIFVAKPYRAGRSAIRLIKATEDLAKARNARLMLLHAKEGTALAAISPRMGYGVQDIIFSKEV